MDRKWKRVWKVGTQHFSDPKPSDLFIFYHLWIVNWTEHACFFHQFIPKQIHTSYSGTTVPWSRSHHHISLQLPMTKTYLLMVKLIASCWLSALCICSIGPNTGGWIESPVAVVMILCSSHMRIYCKNQMENYSWLIMIRKIILVQKKLQYI